MTAHRLLSYVRSPGAETIADFMVLGHIMTAMPTINAIPAVVAAAPGSVTYTDLPLTLVCGVVPS